MSDIGQLFASAMMHQMSLQEQQAQHAEQSRQFEQTLALQKEREREESVYRGKALDLQERMRTDALNEQKLQRAMQEYEVYDPNSPIGKYLGDKSGINAGQYAGIAGPNFDPSQYEGKRFATRGDYQAALANLTADRQFDKQQAALDARMKLQMGPQSLFDEFMKDNVAPYANGSKSEVHTVDVPSSSSTVPRTGNIGIDIGLKFGGAMKDLWDWMGNKPSTEQITINTPEKHVARAYLERLGKLHSQTVGYATKSTDVPDKLAAIYGYLDAVLENPARGGGPGSGIDFAQNFGSYGYDLSPQAGGLLRGYYNWKSQTSTQRQQEQAKLAMEKLKYDTEMQKFFNEIGQAKDKGYETVTKQ